MPNCSSLILLGILSTTWAFLDSVPVDMSCICSYGKLQWGLSKTITLRMSCADSLRRSAARFVKMRSVGELHKFWLCARLGPHHARRTIYSRKLRRRRKPLGELYTPPQTSLALAFTSPSLLALDTLLISVYKFARYTYGLFTIQRHEYDWFRRLTIYLRTNCNHVQDFYHMVYNVKLAMLGQV